MENNGTPSVENRAWHPMEYAHVFLWLVKDMCWAQGWKLAGTLMVVPTIIVAFIITWLQRKQPVTLVHNVAISIWITSNSVWMLAEFYKKEELLKPVSTAGFALGLLVLGIQYLKLLTVRKQKSP
ncbi:MAG TPA: hypothetical protein PK509_14200 [Catalimonadaceae bacterium]|nr:hypothetical protein [Catalimonadaceae bacterium]